MNLGGAVLDLGGGLLLDARGEAIPLRAQSRKVLGLLAARAGQVVGKDELFEAVWGDVHVTDDSLTQCVGEIRRAIGDTGHKIVQTVPKRDYRLVPVVEIAAPPAPERTALKVKGGAGGCHWCWPWRWGWGSAGGRFGSAPGPKGCRASPCCPLRTSRGRPGGRGWGGGWRRRLGRTLPGARASW
jgi:DNA-binding winged helix-turn-helix (wHTH) protein